MCFLFRCYATRMLAMLPRLKTTPPTPNFIMFNTDEETDFKRIRERNFWIYVKGTFENLHIQLCYHINNRII
jgi:hypothetical protein